MSKIKTGDRVILNEHGGFLHSTNPKLYPKAGTKGTVVDVTENPAHNLCRCLVDWDGFRGKVHILGDYLDAPKVKSKKMANIEKEELTFYAIRDAIVARLYADLPMRTMLEIVDYTRSELEESIGDALEELGIGC